MESKTVLRLNAVLFGLVAVLHVLRIALGWDIYIGDWNAPMWASVLAVVIAGLIAYLNWKHAKIVY